MFNAGDQVFYNGRIKRYKRDQALNVRKYVNGYLWVNNDPIRYKATSFFNANVKKPIGDLLSQLNERVKEKGVGVCSYALEFESGHTRYQIADVCHARLPWGSNYPAGNADKENILKKVALNISGHYKAFDKNKDKYKRFVQYIIYESPWKDAFLPSNLEDVIKSGVYLDISKPYSYCVAAAIALRTGSEFRAQLEVFDRLIQLNYSPNVAFIVSSCVNITWNYTDFSGGHHVLNNNNMGLEGMRKFFNEGLLNLNGKSYAKSKAISYSVFDVMAPKNAKPTLNSHIWKACKDMVIVKESWGGKSYSISVVEDKNLVYLSNEVARLFK